MSTTTAQIVGKRLLDLRIAGALGGGEKGGRLHDHAADAVAALRGLLLDEGFLDGMQLVACAQALQGHDLFRADRRERHHEGAHRPAVKVYGAGPALPEATAEARPVQSQVVAQSIEQWHVGIIDRHPRCLTVDVEWNRCGHRQSPFRGWCHPDDRDARDDTVSANLHPAWGDMQQGTARPVERSVPVQSLGKEEWFFGVAKS